MGKKKSLFWKDMGEGVNGIGLKCPNCGFFCMHHERTDIFLKTEGKAEKVHVMAEVEGARVAIDHDMKDNPSANRDGLRLEFSCEGCAINSHLFIEQYKGTTLMYFKIKGGITRHPLTFDDSYHG